MKASLFACGCLSLLADDFARVIIFIFVDILCSVSIPSYVKLASARAFGEIQCSSLVACKAFKVKNFHCILLFLNIACRNNCKSMY